MTGKDATPSETEKFLATLVEPRLEVIKRISFNMGPISIPSSHPKILAAARELIAEGWLRDGGEYPCAGLWYLHVEIGKLDFRALKGRY